jgi:hypothetical protein
MTTALANTIIKDTGVEGPMIERPTVSGSSIKPGTFVLRNSANELAVVNTQGIEVPTLLVIEDKFQGDGSTGGVDVAYAAGAPARAEYSPAGALRYARVPNGVTLAIGDRLMVNNAGLLVLASGHGTTPVPKVFATAEEAGTTSGEQLMLVRIA